MIAARIKTDPWPKILDLLNQCRACVTAASPPPRNAKRVKAQAYCSARTGKQQYDRSDQNSSGPPSCVKINVLELTESAATITWYDPTRCRYVDQRWRRRRAGRAGVCSMTGVLIARGADVFHPADPRRLAANADAMILTRALQCAAASSAGDNE
jgi:hypothetical protein